MGTAGRRVIDPGGSEQSRPIKAEGRRPPSECLVRETLYGPFDLKHVKDATEIWLHTWEFVRIVRSSSQG